ncbi:dihydropteroate synthase [Coxiella burnetii]|uniref:dihydropteroate synthase n=1 Tax=Coxiella burnetii TaxID=777 RepID=UPI0006948E57|nr:dihydropteroate synthase [Coxiella burnetii]ATN74755.1 dihydropteroate synthase [Coxiella burnetii]ATN76658.1 dihydropteroate synthase [Coxiella burnetii]ATN78576.1 dihydropteroate synthase [Coxiella burnetii]ATN80486.1 dihydropteroate synthase [Coxiella burnetii]OYK90372.1 dihydropteroate synthase [Coxiella burnetii]
MMSKEAFFLKQSFYLRLRDDKRIVFSEPAVMGIINVSPNSFYHPHLDLNSALRTAEKMVDEGADILDIGGEATNPFVDIKTDSPSTQIELDRLLPVIDAIKKRFPQLISVDTSRPRVMREAVNTGADMINDQRALQLDDALTTVSALKTPVCLMHFPSETRKPGSTTHFYFLQSVKKELQESIQRCKKAGISEDRIIIDPGFGQGNYGKNVSENFYLLNKLPEFVAMGLPVLSGWSRKSMIGDVLNQPPENRLFGSIAADVLAVYHGASIIRTHDVKATREAIKIATYTRSVDTIEE